MKKLLIGTILLSFVLAFPLPAMAGVDVSISLPPLVVFAAPPAVVVIPETYVYVVPDSDVEIFFYDGWWWRPWEGRWYRSRHYDSGWGYYQRVPSFYRRVPSGWRQDYRDRRWGGQTWNHQPIPHQQVERNWSSWKKNKHWEKQQTWGVQGLKPGTRSQQPSRKVRQSEDVHPRRSPPQQREASPHPSKPAQAKPEKAQGKHDKDKGQGKPEKGHGKPDRGEDEKQDRR